MKTILRLGLVPVLVCWASAATSAPGEYESDEFTVLLLHLNETNGSSLADDSSYGNHATATGTTVVDGRFGKARMFSNALGQVAVDYIAVSNAAVLNPPTALTLEAWVYLTSTAEGWINGLPLINRDDSWSGNQGYSTDLGNLIAVPHFWDGQLSTVSDQALELNRWYHVAFTIESGGGVKTARIYVDGQLVGMQTVAGSLFQNSFTTYIGRRWGCCGGFPYNSGFVGIIDEVRISNKARTPTEFNLSPKLSCSGFEPPMSSGAVTVRGNRALPFRAQLLDGASNIVTDLELNALPVIQVWYEYGTPSAEDVTEQALPAGQSTEGNLFYFDTDQRWHYNLKTNNYSAAGTYTVFMDSGDALEYVVEPTCTGKFVIK